MCKSRDRGSYFYIVNDLVIEYKVENKSSHPTTATTSCLSQRLSVSHSSQSLDFVAGSSSRVKSSGLAGYGTSPMYLYVLRMQVPPRMATWILMTKIRLSDKTIR